MKRKLIFAIVIIALSSCNKSSDKIVDSTDSTSQNVDTLVIDTTLTDTLFYTDSIL